MLNAINSSSQSSVIKAVTNSSSKTSKTLDGKNINEKGQIVDEHGKVISDGQQAELLTGKGLDSKTTLARILNRDKTSVTTKPSENPSQTTLAEPGESRFQSLRDNTELGKQGGLQTSNSAQAMAEKFGFSMPGTASSPGAQPVALPAGGPGSLGAGGGPSAVASASAVATVNINSGSSGGGIGGGSGGVSGSGSSGAIGGGSGIDSGSGAVDVSGAVTDSPTVNFADIANIT
jgi:hypothetical protein